MELPGSDGFAPPDGAQAELDHAAANQAAEEILGANPLVGFDRSEILDALGRILRSCWPSSLASSCASRSTWHASCSA